jgi:hypothetical protein
MSTPTQDDEGEEDYDQIDHPADVEDSLLDP